MTDINSCILYRDFEQGEVLLTLSGVILQGERWAMAGEKEYLEAVRESFTQADRDAVCRCQNRLLEFADSYGFEGNLWHDYLTMLLVSHENAYSLACEIRGKTEGSVTQIALHDFSLFLELFRFPLRMLDQWFPSSCFSVMEDYRGSHRGGRIYSHRIRERICALSRSLAEASDPQEFLDLVTEFYREYGVGKLGLHKAFRIRHEVGCPVEIEPVNRILNVQLEDLVGYDAAKQKLVANTEAFLAGRPANNCLLFGDAGTGKSSSIKGILNRYYEQGLRIIEVYKHQFQDLNDVIAQIKSRNYRFIIYMDDLSFEEFEIEYKYLKALIEGGLEKKPGNVLIYATSNRRNLVRERFSDKLELGDEDDLHSSDTVQEKHSLVNRFGLRIYFGSPDKKEFQNIVRVLAERHGIQLPEDQLFLLANQWELTHGGLSGRTAQQFIDHILSQA